MCLLFYRSSLLWSSDFLHSLIKLFLKSFDLKDLFPCLLNKKPSFLSQKWGLYSSPKHTPRLMWVKVDWWRVRISPEVSIRIVLRMKRECQQEPFRNPPSLMQGIEGIQLFRVINLDYCENHFHSWIFVK